MQLSVSRPDQQGQPFGQRKKTVRRQCGGSYYRNSLVVHTSMSGRGLNCSRCCKCCMVCTTAPSQTIGCLKQATLPCSCSFGVVCGLRRRSKATESMCRYTISLPLLRSNTSRTLQGVHKQSGVVSPAPKGLEGATFREGTPGAWCHAVWCGPVQSQRLEQPSLLQLFRQSQPRPRGS